MNGGIYAPVTAELGAGVGTTMWVCMNRSGRGGTGPGRQAAGTKLASRPRAGAAGEADYSYSTVPVSMLRYNGGLFWNVGSKQCTMPLAAWDT